ncbi:MAG: DedA family protein [Deltaproteobacteria bacterium]|jgi:membrane protein DedA with SNARE-associated domain
MTDDLLGWLSSHEGPWAYALLALACLLEYVFPPFPGDSVALFGIFLSVSAGFSVPGTYVALNVGATVGGLLAYGFGRIFADRERRPGFLRTERSERAIASLEEQYAKHGGLYLLVNRFVPALRAFFFVAAGIARVPPWQVLLYGGASAMLWNALLFALGWLAGESFEVLEGWVARYALVAVVIALSVLALFVWRRRRRPL